MVVQNRTHVLPEFGLGRRGRVAPLVLGHPDLVPLDPRVPPPPVARRRTQLQDLLQLGLVVAGESGGSANALLVVFRLRLHYAVSEGRRVELKLYKSC